MKINLDCLRIIFSNRPIGQLCLNNFLTDSVVGHPVILLAAIQVHPPEALILRVHRSTVLVSILVGLTLAPIFKRPRCPRHPQPSTLMMKVSASDPPGVLLVPSNRDREILGDLVMFLLAHRFGHVAMLVIATLHRIEPVHSIVTSVAVAGAGVRLDEHVALVRASRPWKPTVVRIAPSSWSCLVVCNSLWTKLQLGLTPKSKEGEEEECAHLDNDGKSNSPC